MIRWISPLIVAFWLVMTLLLARMIWFPEHSGLVQVHPNLVWQMFVSQESVATEMQIYDRQQQRIGVVHIATRDHGMDDNGQPRFDLTVTGRIEEPGSAGQTPPKVTWNASSEVVDGERLSRLRFNLRMPESGIELTLNRTEDEPLTYAMTQNGRVVMDSSGEGGSTAMLGPFAGVLPGLGSGLDGLTQPGAGGAWKDALAIDARQATIDYGGRPRPGYRLTTRLLDRHGAVIEFSSAGELLRVTSDDGYMLLNPVYFGAEILASSEPPGDAQP